MNTKLNVCLGALLIAMSLSSSACSSRQSIAPEPVDSDTGCSELAEPLAKDPMEFGIHLGDGYQTWWVQWDGFPFFIDGPSLKILSKDKKSHLLFSDLFFWGGVSHYTGRVLSEQEYVWLKEFKAGDEIECVWLYEGKVIREETRLVVIN